MSNEERNAGTQVPAPDRLVRTEPVNVDLSAELHPTLYVLHPDGSISPADVSGVLVSELLAMLGKCATNLEACRYSELPLAAEVRELLQRARGAKGPQEGQQ